MSPVTEVTLTGYDVELVVGALKRAQRRCDAAKAWHADHARVARDQGHPGLHVWHNAQHQAADADEDQIRRALIRLDSAEQRSERTGDE